MGAQHGEHGEPVERDPKQGEPDRQVGRDSPSTSTGAARVEEELGTPLAGGEPHWTPAAVGSDPASQILLSITRWFSIGEWLRRRRDRRDGTDETTGSEH